MFLETIVIGVTKQDQKNYSKNKSLEICLDFFSLNSGGV